MKQWMNFIIFTYLLITPMLPVYGAEKAPIAFVAEAEYEFMQVLEGTEVTHDFKIKNNGNAPLNIEKVKTT